GLARVLTDNGVKIFTGQRVKDVQGADPKKKKVGTIQVEGLRSRLTAYHIVVATNTPSPINDWFGIYTNQASYRTYVIGAKVPRGKVKDALYWDTGDPYHYVRLDQKERRGKYDILLVGGEDHKTGQTPPHGAPFMNLETWARQMFPMMGDIA